MSEIMLKDKVLLTIDEAAKLYNIGRHKIRELTSSDDCNFVLYVGVKRLVKRKEFENYISKSFSI